MKIKIKRDIYILFYFHRKSNESNEKVKKCAIKVKMLKSENREINELETEGRKECLNHVLLHFFFSFQYFSFLNVLYNMNILFYILMLPSKFNIINF